MKKLNNFFTVFFVPKQKELYNNRRYIPIGVYAIPKYIGEDNGQKLIKLIEGLEGNKAVEKYVFKYRKMGKIILYAR